MAGTTMMPLALTKSQAAEALSVPGDTVLNLTRTDQLRSIMVGKHKRWLLADLHEYIEDQRNTKANKVRNPCGC